MAGAGKPLCVFLAVILAASSLFMVYPINAQSIPRPSVPQFTATLVDHSYYTPSTTPTYTIDPYSGEQKQVSSGSPSHYVENKSIEIRIKNQPFTSYTDSGGHYISLYYNFRYKGHFENDWTYYPFNPDGESSQSYGGWDFTYLVPYKASNSEYTVVTPSYSEFYIPDYGQVDFQVQAQIGYIQEEGNAYTARVYGNHYNFTGQSSDWSSTQTVSITEAATSPSSNPTSEPVQTTTQPTTGSTASPMEPTTSNLFAFDITSVLVAVVITLLTVIAVLVIALCGKTRRASTQL
jgi:hypothetical protein